MLNLFIRVIICCILCVGFIMAILGSLCFISEFLEKKGVDKYMCFPYACFILMVIISFFVGVSEFYDYLFVN